MAESTDDMAPLGTLGSARLSRRTVLGGLMAAAAAPTVLSRTWAHATDGSAGPTGLQPGIPAALVPRVEHAAAALSGGRVLITGGWRNAGQTLNAAPLVGAQVLSLAGGGCRTVAGMNTGRAMHAAAALGDGRALVIGGLNRQPLASAEIYDAATDTWTPVAPMPQSRYGLAATVAGGLVVVTGGVNGGPLAGALVYDVAADRWTQS